MERLKKALLNVTVLLSIYMMAATAVYAATTVSGVLLRDNNFKIFGGGISSDGAARTQEMQAGTNSDTGYAKVVVVGGSGGSTEVTQATAASLKSLVDFNQTGTANDVDATITNATLAATQSGNWTALVPNGSWVNRSGTIAVADTSELFMAVNTNRKRWFAKNQGTVNIFINCDTTATADVPSLKLAPGEFYEESAGAVTTQACNVIGAAGAKWTAKEQ